MQRKLNFVPAIAVLLGGCSAAGGAGNAAPRQREAIPEQVIAMAAPYQDLSAARVLLEDGCYWYRHMGPVESVLLPLRTIEGRPICTARE